MGWGGNFNLSQIFFSQNQGSGGEGAKEIKEENLRKTRERFRMRESRVNEQRPEGEKGESPATGHMKGLQSVLGGKILFVSVECS